jgi:hypothetical protein
MQQYVWDGLWSVNNFQKIIETPLENQENYIAIAKIMKAHYMQYIVDLYGDSPYFEALRDNKIWHQFIQMM